MGETEQLSQNFEEKIALYKRNKSPQIKKKSTFFTSSLVVGMSFSHRGNVLFCSKDVLFHSWDVLSCRWDVPACLQILVFNNHILTTTKPHPNYKKVHPYYEQTTSQL